MLNTPLRIPNRTKTGILGLDLLLGGGFQRGRIVEVYGTEATGKTTVAYHTVAENQERGVVIISVTEEGFYPEYAKSCGVDIEELPVILVRYVEEAIETALDFMDTGVIQLVVIDNLNKGLYKKDDMDELGAKRGSRLTQELGKQLAQAAHRSNATVLLTTDNKFVKSHPFWIGQQLKTTSKKRNSMEVFLTRDPESLVVGHGLSIPLTTSGVNQALHLLQMAVAANIIEEINARYRYKEFALGHGSTVAAAKLLQNQTLWTEISERVSTAQWEQAFL